MKLLTKNHMSQRRLIEILRVIEGAGIPMGARAISDILCSRGYDLGERAVRYNLKILDGLGFTRKEGYSGRVLTPLGARELGCALVGDRIGFVNTRIEEYMFRTSFDPQTGRGEVIANTSIVDETDEEMILDMMKRAYGAGYTISRRGLVLGAGESLGGLEVPAGSLGIATICSITLDGMLLCAGQLATGSVQDSGVEIFDQMIAANLRGPWLLCHHLGARRQAINLLGRHQEHP